VGVLFGVLRVRLHGGQVVQHAPRDGRVVPEDLHGGNDPVASEGGAVPRHARVGVGPVRRARAHHVQVGQRAVQPFVEVLVGGIHVRLVRLLRSQHLGGQLRRLVVGGHLFQAVVQDDGLGVLADRPQLATDRPMADRLRAGLEADAVQHLAVLLHPRGRRVEEDPRAADAAVQPLVSQQQGVGPVCGARR